ncbi:hypothetical protein POJ06DRAFT_266657 [Lipomyces tetrasporus]|uniref:Nudix hydrolase domain-containing protein n=1 Tax=Lipomyces tetrasporus TaxID=54092 RepID=A0AAD7QV48_9ASCO|nr:uncharacterized protein POJ06DRAFT_266657 [Lipomyces tetrasporus]KAJ8102044.1 hypothetical protein POJ06DRAFT_266657 [Lipomyces tetrasporus]
MSLPGKQAVASAVTFLYKSVRIEIAAHLTAILAAEQVHSFPPFVRWFARVQQSLLTTPVKGGATSTDATFYHLKKVDIQSADFFGKAKDKLGFLKFTAIVEDDYGRRLPGVVFLRGQSVAILLLVYPSHDPEAEDPADYDDSKAKVILTVQPRVAAASMSVTEIPAGMFDLDDSAEESGSLSFTAQRELKEECGLEIKAKDIIPLYTHDGGIYMSAGGCDEQIQFFYCRKLMSESYIKDLEGKFGGAEEEIGERITLRVTPLNELLTATQDAKTFCAFTLYNSLK